MVRRNPVQSSGQSRRRMPIQENRGSRVSHSMSMPPPVNGWNAKDAISSMRPTDAVWLRNWFPTQSSCVVRPGFSSHCNTTEAAAILQVVPFEYAASSKLLLCTATKIIDGTTSTPTALATGLTNGYWSFDYLGGLVFLANGADVVKSYNGTAIANPAFTGVTLTNLNQVSTYKSRVYFVQKNTQSMWYGGVAAVAGALTEFNFSTVASVRGNLVFTTHLKGDGGDGGNDDVFVAVFADGDVLTYAGSNPGDATDWALIGHYRIGRPLSRLGFAAANDNVYIITDRGYERLSEVVKYGDSTPQRALLSYGIQKAVSESVQSIGATDDWRINIYQRGQMLIVTVPVAATLIRYHVQNINTGAWCEFRDINARSWGLLGGNAYFGHSSNGIAYAFDDGSVADAGASIRADAHPAWSDLRYSSRNKSVQLIQPFFFANYYPALSINAASDYDDIGLASFSTAGSPTGAIWNADTSTWDSASWPDPFSSQVKWYSRNAIGTKIAFRVAIDTNPAGSSVEWNETRIIYTTGGYL